MDRNKILVELGTLTEALHKQFEDSVGTHRARLEQFDSGLASVAMSVVALFEEEEREVDLAVRIISGDTPDGYNGPVSGRTRKDHYAVVARRVK